MDKYVDKGDKKGTSVAHKVVSPFQRFELLSIVFAKYRQKDVDCHGEIPKCVCWMEHLYKEALEMAKSRALTQFHGSLGYESCN